MPENSIVMTIRSEAVFSFAITGSFPDCCLFFLGLLEQHFHLGLFSRFLQEFLNSRVRFQLSQETFYSRLCLFKWFSNRIFMIPELDNVITGLAFHNVAQLARFQSKCRLSERQRQFISAKIAQITA